MQGEQGQDQLSHRRTVRDDTRNLVSDVPRRTARSHARSI